MTVSVRELRYLAPIPQTLKCRCFIGGRGFRRTLTVILSTIRLRIREDGIDIGWGVVMARSVETKIANQHQKN